MQSCQVNDGQTINLERGACPIWGYVNKRTWYPCNMESRVMQTGMIKGNRVKKGKPR
jgi:hypothetical protein